MGDIVGTKGLVIGVDKKASHVRQYSSPSFQIIEGDVVEVSLDTPLDLVHSRYVLIHNRDDHLILEKIRTLLKPGGYIVLEEPDFTSAKLLNTSPDNPHHKVNMAICQMFSDAGLDPAYGINLPVKMINVGFELVYVDSTLHLCSGNSPVSNLMAESAIALSQNYTATGIVNGQDIERYVENAHNRNFWSIYYSTISVVGKIAP